MKIAITGGAGFIGTALAENLLRAGHELVLIDKVKSKTFPDLSHEIDITDEETLIGALKGVEAIYHLAAEHRDDVRPIQRYYDVNIGGAENLVKAAIAHKIKNIIFTSTVAVYGLDAGESLETSTPDPFNDYGKSKLQSEHVFEEWVHEGKNRSLVTLRLVATFGPGNRGNIYTLMNQIYRKRFIMVGNGQNCKSIAYVGNVTAFLQHMLDKAEQGVHIYNYADKPDLNMCELVGDIRQAFGLKGLGIRIPYNIGMAGGKTFDLAASWTGKTFPISSVRVQKFCANTIVNADKLKETGFEAPYSLSEGLKDMIQKEFLFNESQAA